MNPEQFEELALRVETLTKGHNQLKVLAENEVESRAVQSHLNHLFNENFQVMYDTLYGRNCLSAMAILGSI